jgi:uncharacterized protein YaiI (UPF0178 family)
MRILIDGDNCPIPVLDAAVRLARARGAQCQIYANQTRRALDLGEALWYTVPTTPGSADDALLGEAASGDIVITDDNALARECKELGATPVHNNGLGFDFRKRRGLAASSGRIHRGYDERRRGIIKQIKSRIFAARFDRLLRARAEQEPAENRVTDNVRAQALDEYILEELQSPTVWRRPKRLITGSDGAALPYKRAAKVRRQKRRGEARPYTRNYYSKRLKTIKLRNIKDAAALDDARHEMYEMYGEYEERFQEARMRMLAVSREAQRIQSQKEALLAEQARLAQIAEEARRREYEEKLAYIRSCCQPQSLNKDIKLTNYITQKYNRTVKRAQVADRRRKLDKKMKNFSECREQAKKLRVELYARSLELCEEEKQIGIEENSIKTEMDRVNALKESLAENDPLLIKQVKLVRKRQFELNERRNRASKAQKRFNVEYKEMRAKERRLLGNAATLREEELHVIKLENREVELLMVENTA